MALECATPPTRTNRQFEGPASEGGFSSWKKRSPDVIKWAAANTRNSPFSSFSLGSALSSSTHTRVGRLTPSVRRGGEGRGLPQRQRKRRDDGRIALPAQKGEETSGHVELSYVLTCPSLPPPLWLFYLTHSERRVVGRERKKANLQSSGFRNSLRTKRAQNGQMKAVM